LVRVPFVRVSGKVVGVPPAAEPEIMVSQGNTSVGIELKPTRSFEFWRLDPGKYGLEADWKAPNGEEVHTARAEIEVAGSDIDGIEPRVIPDSNISGQLEFEDDTVKQAIRKGLPGTLVQLLEISAEAGNLSSPEVSVDGTFRLEKVPAGKYRLGLWSDKAWVKSMRLGSKVIEGAVLDLGNGSGGADLSVLVSASTGAISGTVQDDRGNAAGTVVVLTEAGAETGFDPRRTTAGADSTYTFANLPPGSYKLVAVEENDPATQGNAVLGYENLMETVEVGVGEKATKNLKRRMPE
jgi:hypothetical protein